MAKALPDVTLDAPLDKLATATRQTVLSAEPANFAGIAAVLLASKTITGAAFTKADGDVSGRKTTVAQQAAVPITASGTASHIAYDDGAALLGVTTCTAQVLTNGGTVTVPAHKFEFADPT